MTLLQKQQRFTVLVARLLLWLEDNDYRCTFGETYRPPEMAAINAANGKGISHSLHTQRLAIDLNIFKSGVLLVSTPDYKPAGDYWKTLSTDDYKCSWGGDFRDGNHFSIENNGIS